MAQGLLLRNLSPTETQKTFMNAQGYCRAMTEAVATSVLTTQLYVVQYLRLILANFPSGDAVQPMECSSTTIL